MTKLLNPLFLNEFSRSSVTDTGENTSQTISFAVSTIEDSSGSALTNNPFSSEQELSERSNTATPMPDMETITPVSSLERGKKKTKTKNPFLDEGSVVNPFMNYDAPKDKIRVKSRQSVKSSSSTLFDDSNPFRVEAEDQQGETVVKTKVKPKPPNRSSSLVKPEDFVVTLEEDLGLAFCRENLDPEENKMCEGNTAAQVELQENVKQSSPGQMSSGSVTDADSGSVTDADSGECQSALTEAEGVRVSPESLSGAADPSSADCRPQSECAEEINSHSSQCEASSVEHRPNLSVITKPDLHLVTARRPDRESQLSSQLRMDPSPPTHGSHHQLENNKRSLNGGSPGKQGKANTFLGSLKKRFKSLQSKSKVETEENLSEFRAGVPRMTSTPVVKCGGRSQTESPSSYGGDLPPLYRTAALRNQHQRWSFAAPLLSHTPPPVPVPLHLPPGYEFYPFSQPYLPSPPPSVSPYQMSPTELYCPPVYPADTVTSQHFLSAISSTGHHSQPAECSCPLCYHSSTNTCQLCGCPEREEREEVATPDQTRQARQTSVHTQTDEEQEEQEEQEVEPEMFRKRTNTCPDKSSVKDERARSSYSYDRELSSDTRQIQSLYKPTSLEDFKSLIQYRKSSSKSSKKLSAADQRFSVIQEEPDTSERRESISAGGTLV